MNHKYFEKYFNDAVDKYNVRVAYLELCDCKKVRVEWDFEIKRLRIRYEYGITWSFPLNDCVDGTFKKNFQKVFDESEQLEWNETGNPIKTELLAHLRQLYQLDGSLTKAAK